MQPTAQDTQAPSQDPAQEAAFSLHANLNLTLCARPAGSQTSISSDSPGSPTTALWHPSHGRGLINNPRLPWSLSSLLTEDQSEKTGCAPAITGVPASCRPSSFPSPAAHIRTPEALFFPIKKLSIHRKYFNMLTHTWYNKYVIGPYMGIVLYVYSNN